METYPDPEFGAVTLVDRLVGTAYGTGDRDRSVRNHVGGDDLVAVRRF